MSDEPLIVQGAQVRRHAATPAAQALARLYAGTPDVALLPLCGGDPQLATAVAAELRANGCTVSASHRLESAPDRLLPLLVQAGLATRTIGCCLVAFETVDSTNRVARACAAQGFPDGTLVVAESQTRGRGRLDRHWLSPAGTDLLCSLVLYPRLPASAAFRITMLVSIAVVRALASVCGISAGIKWPNDVYAADRKICGILSEFSASGDGLEYVTAGFGINVNSDPGRLPELSAAATSASALTGRRQDRRQLLQAVLAEVDCLYAQLAADGGADLHLLWQQHAMMLGRTVRICGDDSELQGRARAITAEGHLLLEDSAGQVHEIVCGDVSLRL